MTNARRKDAPLGDRFRDARRKADDAAAKRRDAEERLREQNMKQSLSDFFNTIAVELPSRVETLVKKMEKGELVDPHIFYMLSDHGDQSLRGLENVDIEGLAGFQRVRQAAKDLNVDSAVRVTVQPVSPGSLVEYHAISVSVDALEPYKPAPVARPRK